MPRNIPFHPSYPSLATMWARWRLTYDADDDFIETYLKPLSARESTEDFENRKSIAFVPAYARQGIVRIKNSIYQRLCEIRRFGGSDSYQHAIKGLFGGVDLQHSTMDAFINDEILDELLPLAKVGVLLDNFVDLGSTLADVGNKHPYMTTYRAEDIVNWVWNDPAIGFEKLLLREYVYEDHPDTGLPTSRYNVAYRFYYLNEQGTVTLEYWDTQGNVQQVYVIDVPRIPFVDISLSHSLLSQVDRYQMALMNLESADMAYATRANYPIYYEFFDSTKEGISFLRGTDAANDGTSAEAGTAKEKEIEVGLAKGRRFPETVTKPPGYASPDPNVLRVSMEKGHALKRDIQALIDANTSMLAQEGQQQSAEAREFDAEGLEGGIANIAIQLERAEVEIAKIWHMFMPGGDPVEIRYPRTFKIKTSAQRNEEAQELNKLKTAAPSMEHQRQISLRIIQAMHAGNVPEETLAKMEEEVLAARTVVSEPNVLFTGQKVGLVDDKTAAVALGFPEEGVEQAKKDRAERIKLAQEAQGGLGDADSNRGAPEFDKGVPNDEKDGKDKRNREDNSNIGAD